MWNRNWVYICDANMSIPSAHIRFRYFEESWKKAVAMDDPRAVMRFLISSFNYGVYVVPPCAPHSTVIYCKAIPCIKSVCEYCRSLFAKGLTPQLTKYLYLFVSQHADLFIHTNLFIHADLFIHASRVSK